MIHVFVQARRNDACPMKIIRSRHSSLIERTNRSAYAFRFGDIGGRRMTLVPWASAVMFVRPDQTSEECMVLMIGEREPKMNW
jgi:hypothetical protein